MEPLTRVEILGYMGVTAVILLAIAKLWLHLRTVSMLPVSWAGLALPLALGIGLAITLGSAIIYRVWPAYRHSADFYLNLVLKPLEWPDLLWLGLLPGLSEELLFRGVMLSDFGLNVPALVISSILFGILHFSGPQQWPYVIWATVVGLLLGTSALATGNLLVPIGAHIITNLISSCIWKLAQAKANS
ncbi:MAG: CPBP family intramembrane metalloprotease [Oscillatoriaceae bacterium SKW80]|nr:CPBP family intramembrane metalloprotease [Oscillatoriaceae bacterium SKYG93]MCX8121947.1 CPBP family intramembrane metalloprotease [Oscillatoriaceae bacterium SKW80]MDW8454233.1 type II CAAX endopeptidase family protein [Oscillatoriaceae cyanobacterium SKYGB_i_bin93]HIK29098.1 CPBP family intramembrane metalloprotease [Oscillatoriaceae cyanobacterium M7585_C2015_266]